MGDFINHLILNEGTKSFSDKIKEPIENVSGQFCLSESIKEWSKTGNPSPK